MNFFLMVSSESRKRLYSIYYAHDCTIAGEQGESRGKKCNFKLSAWIKSPILNAIYSAVTTYAEACTCTSTSQNAFDIAQPFKDQNGSYGFSHSSA